MGGNAQLGYTLINQRAEQINKAVLELCDCLILHRQKGRNSLNALSKWLDIATSAGGKNLIATLPGLAQGECWVWPAGTDAPVRTVVPKKSSFHPDRRARQGTAKPAAAMDVTGFVASMKDTLSALVAEAEANDPKRLKTRVAELEGKIKAMLKTADVPLQARVEGDAVGYARGREEGYAAGMADGEDYGRRSAMAPFVGIMPALQDISLHGRAIYDGLKALQDRIESAPVPPPPKTRQNGSGAPTPHPRTPLQAPSGSPSPAPARPGAFGNSGSLSKVERVFLTVLAQQARPLERNQLAIFAGYSSKSRHVDNTLSSLRSSGYVAGGRADIQITPAGFSALGPFEPLPTGRELREHWVRSLDKASGLFLTKLCDRYPHGLSRDELAIAAGYSPTSRHVDNTLAQLRTRDLVTGGRDCIIASDNLF